MRTDMRTLLLATVAALALTTSPVLAQECNNPGMEEQIKELFNKTPPYEIQLIDLENEGSTPEVRTAAEGTVILSCNAVGLLSNGRRIYLLYGMEQHANGKVFYGYQTRPLGQPSYAVARPSQPVYQIPTPVYQIPTPVYQTPPTTPAPITASLSPMFQRGLADRASWEQWVVSLSSDYRTGAEYWAGQRSLAYPGSCYGVPTFTAGCEAAKAKMTSTDALRKSEPDYKLGWNAYGH
jgi:hypothetical protein